MVGAIGLWIDQIQPHLVGRPILATEIQLQCQCSLSLSASVHLSLETSLSFHLIPLRCLTQIFTLVSKKILIGRTVHVALRFFGSTRD